MDSKTKTDKIIKAAGQAYAPEDLTPEDLQKQLPEGGKMFESEWDEKTAKHKFRASVYIDPKRKKITYAIAGTRIGQGVDKAKSDLNDDLKLALGLNPDKIVSLQGLNDKVLEAITDEAVYEHKVKTARELYVNRKFNQLVEKDPRFAKITSAAKKVRVQSLREKFDELSQDKKDSLILSVGFTKSELAIVRQKAIAGYDISYTGHSLGAVLSDLAATDMQLRLNEKGLSPKDYAISSTTFDNPGANKLVKKMCKKRNANIDSVKSAVQYKAFNNRPNFINTLDKQVGEKYQIVPDGQKPRGPLANMFSWLSRKVPVPVVKHLFKFLSFGRVTKQVSDHSMTNFDDVLVEDKGVVKVKGGAVMTAEQAITGIEPLEFNKEIFESLSSDDKPKDKDKSEPEFSMKDPETGQRVEFTKSDLEVAVLDNQALKKDTKPKAKFADRFKQAGKKLMKQKGEVLKSGAKKKHSEKYLYSKKHVKRTALQVLGKSALRSV